MKENLIKTRSGRIASKLMSDNARRRFNKPKANEPEPEPEKQNFSDSDSDSDVPDANQCRSFVCRLKRAMRDNPEVVIKALADGQFNISTLDHQDQSARFVNTLKELSTQFGGVIVKFEGNKLNAYPINKKDV